MKILGQHEDQRGLMAGEAGNPFRDNEFDQSEIGRNGDGHGWGAITLWHWTVCDPGDGGHQEGDGFTVYPTEHSFDIWPGDGWSVGRGDGGQWPSSL